MKLLLIGLIAILSLQTHLLADSIGFGYGFQSTKVYLYYVFIY